jgi:Bacterial Ig-like domain (group 2)/PQQ enzyme repeat
VRFPIFAAVPPSILVGLTLVGCGGGAGSAPGNSTAPSITTQPANQTVARGQRATFTVVATGTAPLTYQWKENGAAVSGAMSSTYTTPPTTSSDNGSQFKVVVSNPTGSVTSNAASLTVTSATLTSLSITPTNPSATVGGKVQFMATGTYSDGSTQDLTNSVTWASATLATASIDVSGLATALAPGTTTISASLNALTGATMLTVTAAAVGTDVLTYHNDNARSGQNLNETILGLSNVNSATFGKVGFFTADGKVDAQPLYLSNVVIPGQGTHNVLYVATEHDSLYAFDASTGAVLWRVSLLGPRETTSDDRGCFQVAPEIGITATPVIDRTSGPNGAIYVVAMSKDGLGNYFQRLHALDVTTGAELFGGPKNIQAAFPGTGAGSSGGNVIFDPKQYKERPALVLLNGIVYTSWASHCDFAPYTGWVIGYNASTLAQTSVLNLTPNGSGGAIWMSGAGPAVDAAGNIYFLDGNGTFDTTLDSNGFPNQGNFGNSFLKLSTSSGLAVADYFATFDTVQQSNGDQDLGSGGALVLPDLTDASGQVRHLAVGAGKDKNIYVVSRDAMGKFNPSSNNAYQEIQGVLSGAVFSMPAYFNNAVYLGAVGDAIKAFAISNARLSSTPTSQTRTAFGYPGATPSISANGTTNAILWAAENGSSAALHAYDATNLSHELYNSNQAGSRDQFGPGNKFITPTIANGQVYVGATNGVAVFGLLR